VCARARVCVRAQDNGRQFEVTYTEYDNSELLPLERIRDFSNSWSEAMPSICPVKKVVFSSKLFTVAKTANSRSTIMGTVQNQLDLFVRKYTGIVDQPEQNAEEIFQADPDEHEIDVHIRKGAKTSPPLY